MVSTVKWVKPKAYSFFASVLAALSCVAACITIQYSSEVFASLTKANIIFEKVGPGHWMASLRGLHAGTYYVSVGRPRSLCELKFDDQLVATTKGTVAGLRNELLLGAGLVISSEKRPNFIYLTCDQEEKGAFAPGLTHKPLILPYSAGRILELWRGSTELLLGVACSLLFLMFLLHQRFQAARNATLKLPSAYYVFGAAALLYSISLAHYPRLILTGGVASMLHSLTRTIFSFAFYLLCAHYSRRRVFVTAGHVGLLLGFPLIALYLPDKFETYYDDILPLFSLFTLIACCDLFRSDVKTRAALLLRYISCTWLLAQFIDTCIAIFNRGIYMAPSILALMIIAVAYIKLREDHRSVQIEATNISVLNVIVGPGSLKEKLITVTKLLANQTHFMRLSFYVDAYAFGIHDRPKERWIRLSEKGYRKNTENDQFIDFKEGRGSYMSAALCSGKPQLHQGVSDGAWFSNIPIGGHAILNLSDDVALPAFLAMESFEVIERILPALNSIDNQLAEYGTRLSYALEGLRLVRGDGSWEESIGAIFLDINYYDDCVAKYGEPYAYFVSTVYLPAICNRVRRWAVREGNAAGDSVYLVIISSLMQESCSVYEGAYRALEEILRFIEGEGADMCRAQGYDPIQVQIGVNAGLANITADSFQVRTSGSVVNVAARLQKASSPGYVLAHTELVELWSKDGSLYFEEPRKELVKLRKLVGRRVYLRKGNKKNAA
jgi:hypothetical protein